MKKSILLVAALAATLTAQGQNFPRVFLDLPAIFLTAPDAVEIGNRLGPGLEVAASAGTHWSMARLSAGTTLTFEPKAEDFGQSVHNRPYFGLEAGVGIYRSNGNRCASTHQAAFTALAKGGIRYQFNVPNPIIGGAKYSPWDYSLGGELGYFFIRDMFRNWEVFGRGNYFTRAKVVSADLGVRFFLNMRA